MTIFTVPDERFNPIISTTQKAWMSELLVLGLGLGLGLELGLGLGLGLDGLCFFKPIFLFSNFYFILLLFFFTCLLFL